MDPGLDNANPTILPASDLPTRAPASSTTFNSPASGGTGLFDALIPGPSALDTPFTSLYNDSDSASSSSNDEGDSSSRASSVTTPDATSNKMDLDTHPPTQRQTEPIDAQEIYDLIASISDPEHPLSLGSLSVINLSDITLTTPPPTRKNPHPISTVTVLITPTITHCSLATVIGLGVRVRLERALPPRFRVDVKVKEGTHKDAALTSKQLADKERVAAALENGTLAGVVERMLSTCV